MNKANYSNKYVVKSRQEIKISWRGMLKTC